MTEFEKWWKTLNHKVLSDKLIREDTWEKALEWCLSKKCQHTKKPIDQLSR